MSKLIKIFIVDDHAIFREGLTFVLSQINGYVVIGEACNGKEFIEKLHQIDPDIVLMDISMPIMDGIEATEKALNIKPTLKIITLSSYGQESYYYRMIKAGVMGFIEKKAGKIEIEEAINTIYDGNNYFPQDILRKLIFIVSNKGENKIEHSKIEISKREKQVLTLVCQGFSNNEIAKKLFISPKTVDNHRTNLLSKTRTKNAAHLVMFSIKNNIIEL